MSNPVSQYEDRSKSRCTARFNGYDTDQVKQISVKNDHDGHPLPNTFALVEDENGPFVFDGTRVELVSIHGNGEIRWSVRAFDIERPWEDYLEGTDPHESRAAAEAFGLDVFKHEQSTVPRF